MQNGLGNSVGLYAKKSNGGPGNTDLGIGEKTTTTIEITSSTGTSAIVPVATEEFSGLMSATDKKDLSTKQSFIQNPTNGNIVTTNANGQVTDSGFKFNNDNPFEDPKANEIPSAEDIQELVSNYTNVSRGLMPVTLYFNTNQTLSGLPGQGGTLNSRDVREGGYTCVDGDRVLCGKQTDQSENLIYIVHPGDWEVAPDNQQTNDLKNAWTMITKGDFAMKFSYVYDIEPEEGEGEPEIVKWTDPKDMSFLTFGFGLNLFSNEVTVKLGDLITQTVTKNDTTHMVSGDGVKKYVDSRVAGLLNDRGSWDASSNLFPETGGSGDGGAVMKGDLWWVSVPGKLGFVDVKKGDSFRALTDNPGQTPDNWDTMDTNIGYVPENIENKTNVIGPSPSEYPTCDAVMNYVKDLVNAPMPSNTYKGNNGTSPRMPQDISTLSAFNQNFETSASNIKPNGTASVGTSNNIARADHVHPTQFKTSGPDATAGIAQLTSGGMAIINTTAVQANSIILLTKQSNAGLSPNYVYVASKTPGVSFTINTPALLGDISTVAWVIINPS